MLRKDELHLQVMPYYKGSILSTAQCFKPFREDGTAPFGSGKLPQRSLMIIVKVKVKLLIVCPHGAFQD